MTREERDVFTQIVYVAIETGFTYTQAVVEVVRGILAVRADAWAQDLAKSETLIKDVCRAILDLQRLRMVTGGGNPLARWHVVGRELKEPS